MRTLSLAVTLLLAAAVCLGAEEAPPPGEVRVRLTDGNQVAGRVVSETEAEIEIVTPAGARMFIPRRAIESIERVAGREDIAGKEHQKAEPQLDATIPTKDAAFPDPNDSRLFFAPTGRPLRRGTGQFTDHYVLFPGLSYGLTDNLTVMGGLSLIPGVSFDEQLFYVAPKLGARISDSLALAAGYLFVRAGGEGFENGAGIGFAVATYGGPNYSLTGGYGLAHGNGEPKSILMIGGEARLSRRLFFLSENWFILDRDIRIGEQPFSAGLRICGDRLSVDLGLILVAEVLEEGFPIPWLSVSYQFGSARKRP
jgi:hypothetical protein